MIFGNNSIQMMIKCIATLFGNQVGVTVVSELNGIGHPIYYYNKDATIQ
jgi:hypothetical protein